MGITIVQKSDLKRKKARAPKALILGGGAVTGATFKVGGIKALNDYFANFTVNDFDIFIGISSGSLVATPLMGGISPESMLRSLDGTSHHFTKLAAKHYYRPNFEELIARPLAFSLKALGWLPRMAKRLASTRHEWLIPLSSSLISFLKSPSAKSYDAMMRPLMDQVMAVDFPSLVSLIPTGVFNNRPIEEYIRDNIERNSLTNSFKVAERLTGKKLYICAMELDGARPVIFGPDEKNDVSISEAVMASTALPGFYKPARIKGVDYVDGMVQETSNIDLAIKKKAGLIICYNPFRPYEPGALIEHLKRERDLLTKTGVLAVMYQIVRAIQHSRLWKSVELYRSDPAFKGDIIVIEPHASDADFATLNPMLLSNQVKAARLGFESVHESVESCYDDMKRLLGSYGITMSREGVDRELKILKKDRTAVSTIQALLEGRTE
jgi:predicted acylesterase/phospholipase RssA